MAAEAGSSDAGEAIGDPRSKTQETIVEDVWLDVAHDSDGLLIVLLRFPNGARSQLQLPGDRLGRVVAQLGLDTIRDLVGRPFSELAPALPANFSA